MKTRSQSQQEKSAAKDNENAESAVVVVGGPSGDRPPPEQAPLYDLQCFRGFAMPKTREHPTVAELYGCSYVFAWHDTRMLPPLDVQKYQRFRRAKNKGFVKEKRYREVPTYGEMEMLFTREAKAVRYLIEVGVLPISGEECDKCGKPMKWKREWLGTDLEESEELPRDCFLRRCSCKKGGLSRSIFTGSILQSVNITKNQWLHALYLWCLDVPVGRAGKIVGVSPTTGKTHSLLVCCVLWVTLTCQFCLSATRLFQEFRQIVNCIISTDQLNHRIGGPGVIVQIDESKFGKRQYNRGKRVEGNWVFGGTEYVWSDAEDRWKVNHTFSVVVQDRTRETLFEEIEKWILPGTIIWSDLWKAYEKIPDIPGKNYSWEGVNHSLEFVRKDGVHTNCIEGHWRILKAKIPNRHYHDAPTLQDHLNTQKFFNDNKKHRWAELMYQLRFIRYSKEHNSYYYVLHDEAHRKYFEHKAKHDAEPSPLKEKFD